jgi:hypothetical protein
MGEPADNPAPQKPRKRRRWLIVAVAFVFVLTISWWYWPRGDERFVGKWAMWKADLRRPDAYFDFRSNGSMVEYDSEQQFAQRSPWRVEGQQLVVGYETRGAESITEKISLLVYRLTGWWPVTSAVAFDFREIDSDTIEIWRPANDIFTLRRLPE